MHGNSNIKCEFHLLYQAFEGISVCICNICNNEGGYVILYRNMLSSEQTWHTVCCVLLTKLLTAT
jgi:hypothetical protein